MAFESVLYHNLFVYCGNEPVNNKDVYGNIIGSILSKFFVGVLIGFAKQLIADIIEFVYENFALNGSAYIKLSPVCDYISSILSEITAQFTVNLKKGKAVLNLIVGSAALLVKYIPKILNKQMNGREWLKLVGDIISLALTYLIERMSKKVYKKLKRVKRDLKKHPKDLRLNKNKSGLNLKIKKMGITVSTYIPISQQLLSLIAITIFR